MARTEVSSGVESAIRHEADLFERHAGVDRPGPGIRSPSSSRTDRYGARSHIHRAHVSRRHVERLNQYADVLQNERICDELYFHEVRPSEQRSLSGSGAQRARPLQTRLPSTVRRALLRTSIGTSACPRRRNDENILVQAFACRRPDIDRVRNSRHPTDTA